MLTLPEYFHQDSQLKQRDSSRYSDGVVVCLSFVAQMIYSTVTSLALLCAAPAVSGHGIFWVKYLHYCLISPPSSSYHSHQQVVLFSLSNLDT
jgi:hypothetical protein